MFGKKETLYDMQKTHIEGVAAIAAEAYKYAGRLEKRIQRLEELTGHKRSMDDIVEEINDTTGKQ